jgi:hypothetical protein
MPDLSPDLSDMSDISRFRGVLARTFRDVCRKPLTLAGECATRVCRGVHAALRGCREIVARGNNCFCNGRYKSTTGKAGRRVISTNFDLKALPREAPNPCPTYRPTGYKSQAPRVEATRVGLSDLYSDTPCCPRCPISSVVAGQSAATRRSKNS